MVLPLPRWIWPILAVEKSTAPIDARDEVVMALSLDPPAPLPSGRIRWAKAFDA